MERNLASSIRISDLKRDDPILTDTPEITSLLYGTKLVKRSKRFQVYQQAESPSGLLPNSLVRFNIPSSDCCDFRDSYIQFDVTLDNIQAPTNEVVTYNFWSENNAPPPLPPYGPPPPVPNVPNNVGPNFKIRWYWEYKGYKTIEFDNSGVAATRIADQMEAIDNLPTIISDGLVGSIIITSNVFTFVLGPVAFITYTNTNPNFKMSDLVNGDRLKLVLVWGSQGDQSVMAVETIESEGIDRYPFLEYGAGSLIDKVLIEVNSTVVYELEGYYLLWNILNKMKDVEHRETIGRVLYNEGGRSTRDFVGSRRFIIPLYGVGLLQHIFFLDQIPGCQLRLSVKLASPQIALTTSTPFNTNNENYHVDNARFYYHTLQLPQSVREHVDYLLGSSGIIVGYDQWYNFRDTISGTQRDLVLNFNTKRFLGILCVIQEQGFINNNSLFEKNANFIRKNIQSLRLKIGSEYYPRDRIESANSEDSTGFMCELLRFFGMMTPETSVSNLDTMSILAGLNYEANNHFDYKFEPSGRLDLPSFLMAISVDSLAHEGWLNRHVHSSGKPKKIFFCHSMQ